ncbi:MAG: sigma factor-like helix-turn-helix DNA-binding protein [Ilumatobacteraceae bacterium]
MDALTMSGAQRQARGAPPPADESDALVWAETTLAFEDFYRAQRLGVARALSLTLGDRELAAEATDEAMTRAYQRWGKVGHLDNPGGWVYRVGLNWARSALRKRGRRERSEPIRTDAPTAFEPSVVRALHSLRVDHRAVVVCRFLLGWSEEQTADALKIRRGTAKSRTARALAQLRTELHHLDPNSPLHPNERLDPEVDR